MPHVALCGNAEGDDFIPACPYRDKCYRHKAKPNPLRQTYGSFNDGTRSCEAFLLYRQDDKRND